MDLLYGLETALPKVNLHVSGVDSVDNLGVVLHDGDHLHLVALGKLTDLFSERRYTG